jgi:hypothetical protein
MQQPSMVSITAPVLMFIHSPLLSSQYTVDISSGIARVRTLRRPTAGSNCCARKNDTSGATPLGSLPRDVPQARISSQYEEAACEVVHLRIREECTAATLAEMHPLKGWTSLRRISRQRASLHRPKWSSVLAHTPCSGPHRRRATCAAKSISATNARTRRSVRRDRSHAGSRDNRTSRPVVSI